MRLRNRAQHPPGGYRYTVAQTNWSISPWISFDAAVQQIIAHRRANPYQAQVNGWSLDPQTVADELDAFNTAVCQQMGWTQYIGEGGDDFPKTIPLSPSSPSSGRAVAGGIRTIADWEIAGGVVVSKELANARAKTCSECPMNVSGDLTTWFTEAAARLIKLQLETRNNMKLHTNYDPLLGVCEGCSCVNKLSVWCPLEIKVKHMKPDIKAALHPSCWVFSEAKPA